MSVGRTTPRGLSQVTYDNDKENKKPKNVHFMSQQHARAPWGNTP